MSPALLTTHNVEVDAPDGPAALALERRLVALSPTARMHDDRWVVDVPAVRDLPALEEELLDWVRRSGIVRTTIRIDGRSRILPPPRGLHRSSHWDFIG